MGVSGSLKCFQRRMKSSHGVFRRRRLRSVREGFSGILEASWVFKVYFRGLLGDFRRVSRCILVLQKGFSSLKKAIECVLGGGVDYTSLKYP